MSILATLAGLFATQKAADTALSIVERISTSGMTDQEKADFIIRYQESTKHQSPARRVIAMMVAGFWLLVGLTWLALVVLSIWFDVIDQIRMVRQFAAETIKEPFNFVIMFYFAMGAVTNFRK